MTEKTRPQAFVRFIGEFFGICADTTPTSNAMKLGSFFAGFGYAMVLGGLILLYLATNFPEWSEAARYRIASTVGVVVLVTLQQLVSPMPRLLRSSMVGAWALVAVFAAEIRQISTGATPLADGDPGLACGVIQDRTPPSEIHVDSFALAIGGDLSSVDPDSYLDLLYAGVITYSVYSTTTPPSVSAALLAIGLQGVVFDEFGRDLARFRIREGDGDTFIDTWFCGFDLECGTCDDRRGVYPWPKTEEEARFRTPQLKWSTARPFPDNTQSQR